MSTADRPNILFISLDDCIAFWRYRRVFGVALQTPNLDRICAQSTVFQSAYCQSPVCSPSRASFVSGKSPHQTGITRSHKQYCVDLPAKKLWLFNLRMAGYFCSSGGKVVQGYGPLKRDIHDVLYSDPPKRFPTGRRKRVYLSGKRDDPPPERTYGGFREGPATIDGKQDKMLFDNQVAKSAFHFLNTYD